MLARIRNGVRYLNKHFTNHILGGLTHLGFGPFAMVFHRGRKSDKPYQTPIIVSPHANDFLIALTYGAHVDWYLNVRKAGHCSLRWHKRHYEIDKIETADPEEAILLLPGFESRMLRLMGIRDFVWMRVAS